jgi:hypothetical protein
VLVMVSAKSPAPFFKGLLTDNIGLYRTRPANFLASFLVHVMALAVVPVGGHLGDGWPVKRGA